MQIERYIAVTVHDYQTSEPSSDLKTVDYFDSLAIGEPNPLKLSASEPELEPIRLTPSALHQDEPVIVQIAEQHEPLLLEIADHDEPVRVVIPDLNDAVTVTIPDLNDRVSVVIAERNEHVSVKIDDKPEQVDFNLAEGELIGVGRSLIDEEQEQVRYTVEPIADVRLALITKETHMAKSSQIIEASTISLP